MRTKRVEKMIKREGQKIVPDVFDDVLKTLDIDVLPSKRHFKLNKWIPLTSGIAAAAIVAGVILPIAKNNDTLLDGTTYVAMQIETSSDELGYIPDAYNNEGSPSFTYNVNKKGKATTVIPVNDSAKIIARGLSLNEDYSADVLASSIVAQSTSVGFINLSSKNNIVRISVSSMSESARKMMISKITEEIVNYFKSNYIYGAVIATEVNSGDDILGQDAEEKDEKYAAIYSIYELTKELFADIYNSDILNLSEDYNLLETWEKSLADVSLANLELAVSRLKTLRTQFLEYDYLKEAFSLNLKNFYEAYYFTYDYVFNGDGHMKGLEDLLKETEVLINSYLEKNPNANLDAKDKLDSLKQILKSDGRKYTFYDWLFFDGIDFSDISEDDSFGDHNHDFDSDYDQPDDWENWGGYDDWDEDWQDDWDEDWQGWEDDYRHHHYPKYAPNSPDERETIRRNISIINKQVRYIMEIQKDYRKDIKRILATIEFSIGAGYEYDYDEKYYEYEHNNHDNRDNHWEEDYDYDKWYGEWHGGHH